MVIIMDVTLGSTAQGVLISIGIMGIVLIAPQDRIAVVAAVVISFPVDLKIQFRRFYALSARIAGQ